MKINFITQFQPKTTTFTSLAEAQKASVSYTHNSEAHQNLYSTKAVQMALLFEKTNPLAITQKSKGAIVAATVAYNEAQRLANEVQKSIEAGEKELFENTFYMDLRLNFKYDKETKSMTMREYKNGELYRVSTFNGDELLSVAYNFKGPNSTVATFADGKIATIEKNQRQDDEQFKGEAIYKYAQNGRVLSAGYDYTDDKNGNESAKEHFKYCVTEGYWEYDQNYKKVYDNIFEDDDYTSSQFRSRFNYSSGLVAQAQNIMEGLYKDNFVHNANVLCHYGKNGDVSQKFNNVDVERKDWTQPKKIQH